VFLKNMWSGMYWDAFVGGRCCVVLCFSLRFAQCFLFTNPLMGN